MSTRCRLCTSNDDEPLIEELAEQLWLNEQDGRTWAEAGTHWQSAFRLFATRTLVLMREWHGDH